MFHYLMEEGISDDEWSLRGKILYLHDVTLKLRLFKSISAAEQYDKFKQAVAELREEINNSPVYKTLEASRQERLLTGQELYIGGLRSTLKLAKVDAGYFDGMYAYLSTQVHISPTSFFDMDKRISFPNPAGYQFYFAAYALAHARMLLLRSSLTLAESASELLAKIDIGNLQSMKELAHVPFGE